MTSKSLVHSLSPHPTVASPDRMNSRQGAVRSRSCWEATAAGARRSQNSWQQGVGHTACLLLLLPSPLCRAFSFLFLMGWHKASKSSCLSSPQCSINLREGIELPLHWWEWGQAELPNTNAILLGTKGMSVLGKGRHQETREQCWYHCSGCFKGERSTRFCICRCWCQPNTIFSSTVKSRKQCRVLFVGAYANSVWGRLERTRWETNLDSTRTP